MPRPMPTEPAQPAVAIARGFGVLREPGGPSRHEGLGKQTVRQSQNSLALVNDGVVDEIAVQLD